MKQYTTPEIKIINIVTPVILYDSVVDVEIDMNE